MESGVLRLRNRRPINTKLGSSFAISILPNMSTIGHFHQPTSRLRLIFARAKIPGDSRDRQCSNAIGTSPAAFACPWNLRNSGWNRGHNRGRSFIAQNRRSLRRNAVCCADGFFGPGTHIIARVTDRLTPGNRLCPGRFPVVSMIATAQPQLTSTSCAPPFVPEQRAVRHM